MEYEYVVLPNSAQRFGLYYETLTSYGWAEWKRTGDWGEGTINAVVMRRPKDEPLARSVRCLACGTAWWPQTGKCPHCGNAYRLAREKPKDEPRMWTEGEIEDIARGTKGSVLNDRAMQAGLCGRLERRNEELQAAINVVVSTGQNPGFRDHLRIAVEEFLYPLATKKTETSNG